MDFHQIWRTGSSRGNSQLCQFFGESRIYREFGSSPAMLGYRSNFERCDWSTVPISLKPQPAEPDHSSLLVLTELWIFIKFGADGLLAQIINCAKFIHNRCKGFDSIYAWLR